MLSLSKINCHLSICIYSSPSILAVSFSRTNIFNMAVLFKNCDIKETRDGKYPIFFFWRICRELKTVVVNCRRLIRAAVLFIYFFFVRSNCLHL